MTEVDVRAYRRWAYSTAYRLLSEARQVTAGGGPDVDDIAQEGLVAIWQSAAKHDPEKGALPPFVTRAATLRMRDLVFKGRPALGEGDRTRSQGSRAPKGAVESLDGLVARLDETEAPLPDALVDLGGLDPDRLATVREVRAAVEALPPRERAVVTVVDLLDGPASVAAPIAGVSVEYVRALRRQGYARLRTTLAPLAA